MWSTLNSVSRSEVELYAVLSTDATYVCTSNVQRVAANQPPKTNASSFFRHIQAIHLSLGVEPYYGGCVSEGHAEH